jgi:UDP-3-O-[3-hydroxymyristoyl] glucosamine N-acyltransferase
MQNLPTTVRQIAQVVGGSVEGDGEVRISGLAAMDAATTGDLTFAADQRRAGQLARSRASAALVGAEPASAPMALIRVPDVPRALSALLAHLSEDEGLPPAGIDPSAKIAPDAAIGQGVTIGPNVVVGSQAKIADGCVLCANVVVAARSQVGAGSVLFEGVVIRAGCVVGRNVRIGPNSVVGWDGFGYHFADGVHHKVPHAGNVVIEDDVEIGACACIDKAKFGSTRVGAGTKIDNLVQVAHNVQIGRGCILVGQCGIAGSTRLGNYVVLGGSAGVRDNITVGDGVQCAAFAAIAQDVEPGQIIAGAPAGPAREQFRMMQALPRVPDLLKKVRELESRLAALESTKNH